MRLIRIFLGFIAFTIITAGSIAASMSASTPEPVNDGTSIRFVFDRDFAPFTYEENGSSYGFELDLLRILVEEGSFQLIPEPMIWSEAQLSFQKGD
ncbi:MAG: hypothetical protein LUQ38_05300, partial [Methanotrichaceae archaeon]|nr:hypothetical protein [Methanotrichaceae archaeon]